MQIIVRNCGFLHKMYSKHSLEINVIQTKKKKAKLLCVFDCGAACVSVFNKTAHILYPKQHTQNSNFFIRSTSTSSSSSSCGLNAIFLFKFENIIHKRINDEIRHHCQKMFGFERERVCVWLVFGLFGFA